MFFSIKKNLPPQTPQNSSGQTQFKPRKPRRKPFHLTTGFTLAELLISISIFGTLSLIALTIFLNITHTYRRISLENNLYEEGRILMEKIVREVRRGTIDYEEYHNRLVLGGNPGENYGEYAKKFFHPGNFPAFNQNDCETDLIGEEPDRIWDGAKCVDRLGSVCNDGTDPSCVAPAVLYLDSLDIHTGRNPYTGADSRNFPADDESDDSNCLNAAGTAADVCEDHDATAFCDSFAYKAFQEGLIDKIDVANPLMLYDNPDINNPDFTTLQCPFNPADLSAFHAQSELYLINGAANLKTIFARESRGDPDDVAGPALEEFALSIVRLEGSDTDHDDVNETWECTGEFYCMTDIINETASDFPSLDDLILPGGLVDDSGVIDLGGGDKVYALNAANFVPITPPSVTVDSITFYVAPLEDPHKAFDEADSTIHQQPHVTIVMTVSPSYQTYRDLNLDPTADVFPSITLQTTVTSRIYNEVKSY